MKRFASAAVRHPRSVLAAWLATVALVALAGLLTAGHLAPTHLTVPGSSSDRADELVSNHFDGPSTDLAILLEGDRRELDQQGRRLARRLRERPGLRVVSACDGSTGTGRLRPSPTKGLLVASFSSRSDAQNDRVVASVRRTVDDTTSGPIESHVTGAGLIGDALEQEALSAVERAELIALPALILVLLLVFRSVVAAAIPLVFGVTAVLVGQGLVGLLSLATEVDVFAVTLAAMMGLALGVDYSLLLVSRFREELHGADATPGAAAVRTARTAGRTVLFAGATLAAALLVGLALAPGGILFSTVAGALAATAASALSASVAMPALLALLGRRVERWSIAPRRRGDGGGVFAPIQRALRRPGLTAALVGAALLALSTPALQLATGPPDASQLPAASSVRQDTEAIARAAGAGFASPFVIVAAAKDERALARDERRRAVAAWSRALVHDPAVRGVGSSLSADRRSLQLTVAPEGGPNANGTRRLHRTLRDRSRRLGRKLGLQVAVGGQPAEFGDFRDALAQRAPWLVLAVAVVAALVLLALFRSLLLPLLAVALNLLAVGAAFGALALLFQGSAPLGGPGFIDAVSLVAAYTVVFGLSIDYQVFVLARVREEHLLTGETGDAVLQALRSTAAIVSGAAAIMVAVFLAFAHAEMAAIRQLGTALAVALVIDATLVRLLLLPALVRLLGERVWWLPAAPGRVFPGLGRA